MDRGIQGVAYIILSSVSFGLIPILAKLAYRGGASTFSVLFLRFAIASVMILIYLAVNKIKLALKKEQLLFIIILGVIGYSGTTLSLFMSYNYISVGLATMILYIYPIIVTILSLVIYKEKIYRNKVFVLMISSVGIYLLIGGGNISFNMKGMGLAFLSSLFYSFYVLGLSHPMLKEIDSFVVTFYVSIGTGVVMLCLGLFNKDIVLFSSVSSTVCIILMAFISTVIALMAFMKGVKIIGPSKASIYSNLEPIVGMTLGFFVLKEKVSIQVLFGSMLIIISIIILASEKKNLA